MIRVLAAASLILASVGSASGVIIAGGDGTGNTSAPADDPGWANVGELNGDSCVYLGNGWVLTASHVGMGSVWLGSSYYAPVTDSYTRLYEPSNPAQLVDLAMFQLQTMPTGLSAVTVSSTEPDTNANSQIVAIGNGRDRAASETFWDSSWNVVSGPVLGGYAGYYWASSSSKRWGTNNLLREVSVNDGSGITDAWKTLFNSNAGDSEMQAAPGDSGGGVFYKRGDTWELTGIMLAIDMFDGQPGNTPATSAAGIGTAVFGNPTYFADLSVYSGEITTIMGALAGVPEPSSLVLLLTASIAGWVFWHRRAAAR
jgi:hypothetical protein